MGKQNDVGVFQLDNGMWAFRFTFTRDGKRFSKRSAKDEFGNPLKTKREAIKARQLAVEREGDSHRIVPVVRKTCRDVYREYCEYGRKGRAYQTIRKQDSLWNNHLDGRFGKRYVDEISSAEIVDYLTELYYVNGFSYQYTEAFLKMFYLIFGQAYSRNYLGVDCYNKLCVNKDTKIKMPKMKNDEETEITAFSQEELVQLDSYFKGTNAETAYLLGRYCGLRISECYGLKWSNINLQDGTICIDRQMQYQDGVIKLVGPKTRNAKRTMYINDVLKVHLQTLKDRHELAHREMRAKREQNQRFIKDIDGAVISSLELVNSLENGKIQTVNSMKYHAKQIHANLNIKFKYHCLRHTYGTRMAEMNTPAHLLCNQMGHGNIHVTQRYYVALSQTGIQILTNNLNQL